MRGLNVNGFIVVETLGSGRAGILYLARHPTTGQEAIIRVASTAENELTAKVFLEEASSLLPAASDVQPTVASDGSRVLMALERAPGSGFSQHSQTQRIVPAPAPPPPGRAGLALAFIGLTALAAAVTLVVLTTRQSTTAASPPIVVASPVEPDAGVVAQMEPVVVAPVEAPVPQPLARAPMPQPACSPTERWKKTKQLDLQEIEEKANAIEPVELARTVQTLGAAVAAAKTTDDCARLDRTIGSLVKRAIKPGKKSCIVDDRWLKSVQSEMNQTKIAVSRQGDDKRFAAYEDAEDVLVGKLRVLRIGDDCVALDAEVDRYMKKWQP
jgi:hypothetical protein